MMIDPMLKKPRPLADTGDALVPAPGGGLQATIPAPAATEQGIQTKTPQPVTQPGAVSAPAAPPPAPVPPPGQATAYKPTAPSYLPATMAADTTAPASAGPASASTPPAPAPAPVPPPSSAPAQTTSYSYTGSAADLFPGADGKGPTTGGSTPGAFWQAFDQSQSTPLSPEEKSKAQRMMQGDQSLMNEYKQKYGNDWLSKWGADQDMYASRLNNQTATAADVNALKGKSADEAWAVISGANNPSGANYFNAFRAMTPDQRKSFLDQWPEGTRDRAMIEGSLAAQGITIQNGDTGQRWDGKTQNNGPMASAIPVYSNDVRGQGANSQGLAGFGAPPVPPPGGAVGASPTTFVPADTGPIMKPGGVQTISAPGGGSTAPTGAAGTSSPPPVAPPGAPGGLNDALEAEARRQLSQPSAYDDELFQKVYGQSLADLEDKYTKQDDALNADLDSRGLRWSTVAGQTILGEGQAKKRELGNVMTNLLRERATTLANDRAQAFSAASGQRNRNDTQQQLGLTNEMDRLKLQEYLRQGGEDSIAKFLEMAMGAGQSGIEGLGTAGAAYNPVVAGGTDQATAGGNTVADWAALAAYFLGNKNKKPTTSTGAPVPAPAMGGAYG